MEIRSRSLSGSGLGISTHEREGEGRREGERDAESGQIEKFSGEAILTKASAELLGTSVGKMAFTS